MAVDVVHDGEEAVAAGLGTTYDAIVLDVMLPRLDGFEVTRRLRDQRGRESDSHAHRTRFGR